MSFEKLKKMFISFLFEGVSLSISELAKQNKELGAGLQSLSLRVNRLESLEIPLTINDRNGRGSSNSDSDSGSGGGSGSGSGSGNDTAEDTVYEQCQNSRPCQPQDFAVIEHTSSMRRN